MNIKGITGNELADWIIAIVGNVFLVILIIRLVGAWMKDQWGQVIGILVGGIIVAAAIYMPDQFKSFLTGLWKLIMGQG